MKVASELKWGGRLNLHDGLPLAAFEEHLCHNVHTLSLRLAWSKWEGNLVTALAAFEEQVTKVGKCGLGTWGGCGI